MADDGLINREQKNMTDIVLVALPLFGLRRVVCFHVADVWMGRMGLQKVICRTEVVERQRISRKVVNSGNV